MQLVRRPPFENPHHTATAAAIIGGGSGLPRPGAASRAHRGVLFLDEAPEYERRVLDALRQPLESGELVIHRSAGTAAYPGPVPAGPGGQPLPLRQGIGQGRRLHLHAHDAPPVPGPDVRAPAGPGGHPAAGGAGVAGGLRPVRGRGGHRDASRGRVRAARGRQLQRLRPLGMETNSQVPGRILRGDLRLAPATTRILDHALERGVLTARGYDRVLRLAWTLADLARRDAPDADDIGQALGLRQAAAAS